MCREEKQGREKGSSYLGKNSVYHVYVTNKILVIFFALVHMWVGGKVCSLPSYSPEE